MAEPMLTAHAQAALLRDLVDCLIPGDDTWPGAGVIGVQAQLAARLLERDGEAGLPDLVARLRACGAPFDGKSDAEREAVVAAFEAANSRLFAFVRDAVYFAYYDSPVVIAVVQALGQPYNAIPVHRGYRLPPFDRTRDAPRHNRGAYVPTDAVERVDLSGLPHLNADSIAP